MSRQEIDLSPLLSPNRRFAVRCETEEEAKLFIAAVIEQFPDKTTNLSVNNTRWRNDNNGEYGGTAYFPDLNNADSDSFVVGDVEYAKHHSYKLIKFTELLSTDIDESDADITSLLS